MLLRWRLPRKSTNGFLNPAHLIATSQAWANAQTFASVNNGYLAQYGINAVVTGINLDAGKHTVLVRVFANLDRMFPSVVPEVIVSEDGYAEVRVFTR